MPAMVGDEPRASWNWGKRSDRSTINGFWNMLLEEAFYMERQRKQQPKQPQKDPSDKNFYHKDQFHFFVKQIGTHTANKKFPENLQFKKYLVVDILTYLIMKTLL